LTKPDRNRSSKPIRLSRSILVTTTEREKKAGFRLTVLNPGGRDLAQDYSLGWPGPNDPVHPPVNFHAYAAATSGSFEHEAKAAIKRGRPVLLLLRGDFRESQRALRDLKRNGLTVAVSFKETGLHQIAKQLSDPRRAARFREIVEAADGCLGATFAALTFYGRGEFIPTPYPLEDSRWNFSLSLGERKGIFVGTREWDVPSRHHLAALLAAISLGETVTVFDPNPRNCRKLLEALGRSTDSLRIIGKRLSYRDYLAEMSRHRIVFQADRSAVPGQVAGDALLCRMPCLGGDGAIDRLGFPETCGYGRSLGELTGLAAMLLRDSGFYNATVAKSQEQALERLTYAVVAVQLERFFSNLANA
jgi:hypothetical protein